MSDHVVVPTVGCADATGEDDGAGTSTWCSESRFRCAQCVGCLGDGTRAVLDQAVRVEQKKQRDAWSNSLGAEQPVWVEVSDE